VGGTFGEVVERLRRSTVQVKTHRNGSGSGVIWSQDGQIVTNAHVVEGAGSSGAAEVARVEVGRVEVELWDGRLLPGRIVKRDRRRDVAALKVEASGLPAVTPGDSNALRVGELVIAVGNPFGFTGAASTGVVHRLNWSEGSRGGFENRSWVVSQLRLAPGNSGGPLANAHGEVVGLNTMIAGGLALAIPSYSVAEFLRAPVQAGLGVVVRPVSMGRFGRELAFIVLEVVPDSPAERASLLQGDVLVGAGGRRFQSVQDLEIGIHASREGILELQFRRGANPNIRTVAIRMTPASVRAA
jgi:serine protease Do